MPLPLSSTVSQCLWKSTLEFHSALWMESEIPGTNMTLWLLAYLVVFSRLSFFQQFILSYCVSSTLDIAVFAKMSNFSFREDHPFYYF